MDLGFKRILQKWFPMFEWATGKALESWRASLVFFVAFGYPDKDVTCSSISCWMHLLVHMVIHLHLEVRGGELARWCCPLPSSCLFSPPPRGCPTKPTIKKKNEKGPRKGPKFLFFSCRKRKGVAHRWSSLGRASSPHTRRAPCKRATQAKGGAVPWHV